MSHIPGAKFVNISKPYSSQFNDAMKEVFIISYCAVPFRAFKREGDCKSKGKR